MKHRPRVSIGLPVFNGENYLEDTLESILAQTFTDFELIICDNASTDRTGEICQQFAEQDTRIRYYRNSNNLGASPNYNRAFNMSRGEFFKWSAHDDLIAPDYLAKCVHLLDSNPDAVLCFTGAKIIDENSRFLRFENYKADIHSPIPHIKFRNVALNVPDGAQIPFVVFGLIRSEILKRTGLIKNFPNSDIVLIAELSLYGTFVESPEALLISRYHPKQSIRGELASGRDRVLWFDTSLENKIVLHKWMHLAGFLDVINRASINRYQKLLCYLDMVRWSFEMNNFKALVKDVLLAAWAANLRLFRRSRLTQLQLNR